jgi:hypothetical protein
LCGNGLRDFCPERLPVFLPQAVNGDFDGSLGQPQIDSRLGIGRSGRVARQVDLEGLELRQLAGRGMFVAEPAERAVEERQGPPPLENPFGGLGVARLALVAGFPFAEVDRQRPLAAPPLLGVGLGPLVAGEPAGGRQEESSKTSAIGIGISQVALLLGLINSAWVQANQPTVSSACRRRRRSASTRSISSSIPMLDIDVRERRLIKDECDRLDCRSSRSPAWRWGWSTSTPACSGFIERVKRYLDLAYEYEAKNVLLVLGEYIWNQEVIPPAEQWRTGVENCRAWATTRRSLACRSRWSWSRSAVAVNSVDTMVRFLDDCDHPACRRTSTSRTWCWRASRRSSCGG